LSQLASAPWRQCGGDLQQPRRAGYQPRRAGYLLLPGSLRS